MRLLEPVRAAQIGILCAAWMVAVFDELTRRIGAARAEIHREHRLHAGGPAPGDVLVRAEFVGLRAAPGEIEPPGALLSRADAIFPVVAGEEITSRIADDGRTQLFGQLEHVPAEAVHIGCGMPRFVDSAVHAAAHMFDEGAEHASVEGGDGKVPIDHDLTGQHGQGSPG